MLLPIKAQEIANIKIMLKKQQISDYITQFIKFMIRRIFPFQN